MRESMPLHVKPKPGVRVLDPATSRPLPAEGCVVSGEHASYWERRRQDGDVEFVETTTLPERDITGVTDHGAGKVTIQYETRDSKRGK